MSTEKFAAERTFYNEAAATAFTDWWADRYSGRQITRNGATVSFTGFSTETFYDAADLADFMARRAEQIFDIDVEPISTETPDEQALSLSGSLH